jgi:tetratricopeptide (TPR) repeat protein
MGILSGKKARSGFPTGRLAGGLLLAGLFLVAAGCAGAPKRQAPPGEPKAAEDLRTPAALVKSGNLNFSLGRYEQAVADFTKAIAKGGGDALAYNTRGRSYFELGRYEDALTDASRAVDLDPRSDTAWNTRGYILYTLRRYEEALRDLDRALEINPRHEGAYNHRGLVHTALERYDRALADFDQALGVDPDYHEVYANKAEAYERKGSKQEAVEAYREFLRRATSPREARGAERARERIRILTAQ